MSDTSTTGFSNEDVAEKFAAYSEPVAKRLLEVRKLILKVAAVTPGVGSIEEALRWGQPSYLTTASGSGSTIRIDATGPDGFAIYFICHTNLVDDFAALYPGTFRTERNRALLFGVNEPLPTEALVHCIGLALTYHARTSKRRGRPRKAKAA